MTRPALGATSRVGRYTQRIWLRAAVLEGVVLGVFLLNEYVAKKTLGAGDALLTALVVGPTAALLFAAWWSGLLAQREKASTFLVFGLLGRLSLLLVPLAATAASFTAVIAVATFLYGAVVPAANALIQRNFAAAERGRVLGLGSALQALTAITVSFAVGRLYDWQPGAYRFTYAVAAVCGFFACLGQARLRFRARAGEARERRLFARGLGGAIRGALRRPFAGALGLLGGDRGFRRYEMGFMAYGLAWMMLQPTIPVFLVERLNVAYADVANARGLIYFTMIAACSHPFGRLLDRIGPLAVSRLAFAVLALFPLLLAAARGVGMVSVAFLVFGVGMAAVNLGWTTGPIHFARERDSSGYMGAHVALVGLRAIAGGPFGIWFYRVSGSPAATFSLCSALFLLGALVMGTALKLPPAPIDRDRGDAAQ
ncbi:MAG TPA: MFS transporter [Candidatus Methanoperedens sp.]|nr:MFS transporter [Candidatus Methanoperedens sp.]